MAKRNSNHSIDRFLLVTVLGWYYRGYYLFCGNRQEYSDWVKGWSEEEKEYWADKSIINPMMLARAMNICLQEADGDLLRRSPDQARKAPAQPMETSAEADMYKKLKTLMQLQFSGEEEREALRQLAAARKAPADREEVGIQRKTVQNLVKELVTLEERLQALQNETLADWLAARVQGFRLRQEPCSSAKAVYCIAPVGQPDQQMAAVQAAYYPFLDKANTQRVLELLGLTSERRQSLTDISDGDEKADFPSGGPKNSLTEQLDLALAAVETVWKKYGEEETDSLFWYELTYHSWQCKNGELVLCPRAQAIPLLPWQVVYSNGYFYLCGLRLDLPADVTGGDLQKELVFSNLRLDRIRDLHPVDQSQSDVDYTVKGLRNLIEAMYQSGYRAPLTYRDESTIMYSGTPEQLIIDCDPALMNSVVDDFGRNNVEQAVTLNDGRVRLWIKGAVWGGARQWLLQHAGRCCLAPVESQAEYRRELAETLRKAAESYES